MEAVTAIERCLTSAGSEKHFSDFDRLYELSESADLNVVAEALQAIGRALSHQRRRLGIELDADTGDGAKIVEWLKKHTEAYHTTLARLATSANARAQVCAVRLAMAAVRTEAEEVRAASLPGGGRGRCGAPLPLPPPERRVQDFLSELLLDDRWSGHVVQCLTNEFVKPFIDIRHYALSHVRHCAEQVGKVDWAPEEGAAAEPAAKKRKQRVAPFVESMRRRGRTQEEFFTRALALLADAPEPRAGSQAAEEEAGGLAGDADAAAAAPGAEVFAPTGRPAGFFLREYRKVFQGAWLQLLGLRVPLEACVPLLQLLPGRVMPHLSQPLLLADFYLRAFHSGSTEVSVLSLSGLLLLLTRHGLGDPEAVSSSSGEYYARLYSLIKPETFKLPKRARFQRLVAASLESGLLPARFAATFAKKCLCTAVVCADPGTVMWLMAVAYTLIQKHHSHCKYLLHRPPAEGSEPETLESDPFDASLPLAAALDGSASTSLWELQLLRRHHVMAIATLAKLFLRPFFKPTSRKLDPELFLDQGFHKTFQQALRSGERQMARLRARGEKCPVAFTVQDDAAAAAVFGWAAALSTSQRQIGPGL